MCKRFIPEELNSMTHKTKNDVIYQMQDRLDKLDAGLIRPYPVNFFIYSIRLETIL